jgi:hypothetical protein
MEENGTLTNYHTSLEKAEQTMYDEWIESLNNHRETDDEITFELVESEDCSESEEALMSD